MADTKRDKGDVKRDSMEETLGKIEGHLAVGNEKFKWMERAGWLLGVAVVALIGYMITMSVDSYHRDADQNGRLISIEKDIDYVVKQFKGE